MSNYIERLFSKSDANVKSSHKKITIGAFELSANQDHKLDEYLKIFPEYSQNFPRLTLEILRDRPEATIIDVGANIGDTVALLRKYNVENHIYCVEGDEVFYSYLSENARQFKNLTLLKYYLTDNGDSKSYVVDSKGGTARIVKTDSPAIESSLITLDQLAETTDLGIIGILKIDTDGFDCKIIRGSAGVVQKHKPVLFFEYDYDLSLEQNETPLEILTFIRELGYSGILFYDNFGKLICATDLTDTPQLTILDKYIQKGKGSFPYYDVAVFHESDDALLHRILDSEICRPA